MNTIISKTALLSSLFFVISLNVCYPQPGHYGSEYTDKISESYSEEWESPSPSESSEEKTQVDDNDEEDSNISGPGEGSFVVSSDVDISGLLSIAEKLEDFPGIRKTVSNILTSIVSIASRDSRGPVLLQALQQPVMDFLHKMAEVIDETLNMLGPLTPSIMASSADSSADVPDTENLSEMEEAEYFDTLESLNTPKQIVDFLNGEIDGDKTEYVLNASRVLFGNPVELFFEREAVCTGYSRFAQEALENMPEGVAAYNTTLIVETYDDLPIPHIMVAYQKPDTGKWGFMSPWDDHSPEMIEDAGISPDNPEAIVEYITAEIGGRERITFLTDDTFRIFDQSYIINEDGTFEKENFLGNILSKFSIH